MQDLDNPPGIGGSVVSPPVRSGSLEDKKPVDKKRAMLGAIQRQASLPAAPNSPARNHPNNKLLPPKIAKGLVRMNSDPKILPSSEEARLEALDEIDLLHKIAKTPNILKEGPIGKPINIGGVGKGNAANASATLVPPGQKSATGNKNKLVKQKSLNRTLSTSVLRIPKKRSFWSSAWVT